MTEELKTNDFVGKEVSNDEWGDDDQYQKPPSNWIKWGKIGDKIKGTFVGIIKKRDDKTGQMVDNYEIIIEAGFYHDIKQPSPRVFIIDENPTVCDKGEIYVVGGKTIIINVMRKAKFGQKVMMRYIDDFTTPKGVAKTVEVKLGPIDQEWLANNPEENN